MSDDAQLYDAVNVPFALTEKEFNVLQSMIASPGWSVFMKIKNVQANKAVSLGMSLITSETDRNQHRAKYHGCKDDLEFEEKLNEASRKTLEEADAEGLIVEDDEF